MIDLDLFLVESLVIVHGMLIVNHGIIIEADPFIVVVIVVVPLVLICETVLIKLLLTALLYVICIYHTHQVLGFQACK